MNFRTYTMDGGGRKRRSKRTQGAVAHWSLVRVLLPFFFPLAILFTVVVFRVMFQSETEQLHRSAARMQMKIHECDREIQHLNNKLEHFSRRQFINQQVARFNLPLRNPQPGQMRNLVGIRTNEVAAGTGTAQPPRKLIISRR
jgi:hypothetical protein